MTERALLRSILEQPDEDAARLMYADWLEERGDARGEFIRVQCELSRADVAEARRVELEVREWQLQAAHERDWVGPLRGWVESWQFRRGFVEEVTLSARDFLEHAEDMFQWTPLRSVRLFAAAECIPELAACPYLSRLARLDLSSNNLGNAGVQVLAVSPQLSVLDALDLRGNNIETLGARALTESPHLTRLTSLDLRDNPIGAVCIQLVALSPYLGRQKPLYLHHDRIQLDAREALEKRFGERLEFRPEKTADER